jgi:hypothetical protein
MSDSARPELATFHELETLVRHLGDELAGFRRRALVAEARVRELEGKEGRPAAAQARRELAARCTELEHENAALKGRLDSATARARQMLDRVRFIRQQTQASAAAER